MTESRRPSPPGPLTNPARTMPPAPSHLPGRPLPRGSSSAEKEAACRPRFLSLPGSPSFAARAPASSPPPPRDGCAVRRYIYTKRGRYRITRGGSCLLKISLRLPGVAPYADSLRMHSRTAGLRETSFSFILSHSFSLCHVPREMFRDLPPAQTMRRKILPPSIYSEKINFTF